MTFVLFGVIALFLLYVINLLKVEYTFFILFFLHLVSGLITQQHGLNIFGVSLTGIINFLTLGMLILNLPHLLNQKNKLRHHLLLYFFILFLFYAIPLFYNFEFDTFTRFVSRFGAIISIYYLGQISFQKIKNIETKFIIFLKYFFSLLCITGTLHAISINFNIETAKTNSFTFFFFEYPHSLSIFAVSLFPIFFYYIYNKQVSSYYYLLILGLLPITILFSGAKIGLIVYVVSLSGTIIFTFRKKLSHYLIASVILLTGAVIFINTPVFKELVDVLSVPLDNYIFDTRSYSINSMHTRIKVWSFMIVNLLHEDNLLFGFGWRSWNLKYITLAGAFSSQSDYLTILFDLGLVGVIGFLLVRILILYCFIKEGKKNIRSYYLAIGTLCSLYLGGLTENIEGYPSTSWLIPFFLSISHFLGNSDPLPDTAHKASPKLSSQGHD